MRENHHIINRQSYQNTSSFKIRQPINEIAYQPDQNLTPKYLSKDHDHRENCKDHKMSSISSFYEKPQRLHTYAHEREEHSRELSYNSRGSNVTRNSMKMSDYIALEAKNLLNNKDKFKYEGHSKYQGQFRAEGKFKHSELTRHDRQYRPQAPYRHEVPSKHEVQYKYEGHYRQPQQQTSHMRSNSMQCYPSNFKMARGNNDKSFSYINTKQTTTQPTEIPSFGIEWRTTVSGQNPYSHKTYSLSKYPSTSFKLQQPSVSQRRQTINTEIDQRIQKLRASSTSVQHKERLSRIKQIDQHKLENMDKINIKIKNILTTLENQEDYHKIKSYQKTNDRVKTESCVFYDYNQRQKEQEEEQSLLSKYTKPHETTHSRFSRFDLSHNDTFNNSNSHLMYQDFIQEKEPTKTALGKYCENNASSYYYYEDEQAMIKSSESPFKSSPDRSIKKNSLDKKDASKSMSKNSKSFFDVVNRNPVHTYDSTKPTQIFKEYQNSPKYSQSKYQKNNGKMLTNIPECETQIIQSKAYEYNNYTNGFVEAYHTFDNRKSTVTNKDFKTQITLKEQYSKKDKPKRSQIQQRTKYCQSYMPGMNSKLDAKETQTKRLKKTRSQYTIENVNKKSNLIYFKMEQKQKYIQNSGKHSFKPTGQDYIDQDHAIREITEFTDKVQQEKISKVQNFRIQRELNSPQNIVSYNERKHTKQSTFHNKVKDFIYSDSIKETPRIESQNTFGRNNLSPTRSYHFKTQAEDKLDEKFKQYERKLQKYQKGMSASKILESHRSQNHSLNTRRDRSLSIQISQDKYSNQSKSFRTNSNFKPTVEIKNFQTNNPISSSEQNMQKLLQQIRRQRMQKEMIQREGNSKAKKYQQKKTSDSKSHNKLKGNQMQNYCKLVSTPPNNSKRELNRFPKQDHEKFIQSLRRDRQQVAQLSQRKSRLSKDISPQNDRFQPSNQRSQSNNSKVSSNTIVKGRNIDDQITKIQRKMHQYNQMKKDLKIDSKINTQRTQNQHSQIQQFDYPKTTQKDQFKLKEQKRQKCNTVHDKTLYLESKPRNTNFSSGKKSNELLKIVTLQNSFVRVKNSILKELKNNSIKNYLDDEIQKESNSSKSPKENKELTTKTHNSQSKENLMPATKTTIDSPKYPSNKRVVLGLAQNLVMNSINDYNSPDHGQATTKTQIKTPKLLKNLKNKLNQKCIIKKKAQKRGFRSQFINDLHEDNEIIRSAKKIQQCDLAQNDQIESTSRYSPQNKQLLMKILAMIENQILMDEKLRNEKKMFNVLAKNDKWTILMSEYIRQNPSQRNILLSKIVQIFTLSDEESNPFFSTRGVDYSLEEMVRTYGECRDNWKNVVEQISQIPHDQLTSCGLNEKNLDIERKGYIEADDLARFINMQLNKYYRKRDIWLVWERMALSNGIQKESQTQYKLCFDQFMNGLGLVN